MGDIHHVAQVSGNPDLSPVFAAWGLPVMPVSRTGDRPHEGTQSAVARPRRCDAWQVRLRRDRPALPEILDPDQPGYHDTAAPAGPNPLGTRRSPYGRPSGTQDTPGQESGGP